MITRGVSVETRPVQGLRPMFTFGSKWDFTVAMAHVHSHPLPPSWSITCGFTLRSQHKWQLHTQGFLPVCKHSQALDFSHKTAICQAFVIPRHGRYQGTCSTTHTSKCVVALMSNSLYLPSSSVLSEGAKRGTRRMSKNNSHECLTWILPKVILLHQGLL